MSEQSPKKFYPYYRVAFLVKGTDKASSYFSFPEDLSDPFAYSNVAANIDITKSFEGIFGTCVMRLYNLSDNHRAMLFHEPYWVTELDKTGNFKRVVLSAGYLSYNGGERHLSWAGIIRNASSYKQGDSVVTEIVADELGFINDNSFVQLEINKGKKVSVVFNKDITNFLKKADYTKQIEKVATQKAGRDISMFFPEKNLKIVTDFEKDYEFTKDKVLNGSIQEIIKYLMSYIPNARMTKVDNVIYITDKQTREGKTLLINAENGLQSTPRLYGYRMTLNMMFEPRIHTNQTVRVESVIAPNMNDEYSVAGYAHHLTLGDGTRPSATTDLNLVRIDIPG